jgi:hypothetical protein
MGYIVVGFVAWLVMGFVVACAMGFVVACVASDKGFWVPGWCFYGFVLWPIALGHVLVAKPKGKVDGIAKDDPSHVREGLQSGLPARQ